MVTADKSHLLSKLLVQLSSTADYPEPVNKHSEAAVPKDKTPTGELLHDTETLLKIIPHLIKKQLDYPIFVVNGDTNVIKQLLPRRHFGVPQNGRTSCF